MEEDARKELEALKGMVLSWKKSYLDSVPEGGRGEYLADEFLEEIETQVYPYTRRMCECNYLSESEVTAFLDFCYTQVEELRESLREEET